MTDIDFEELDKAVNNLMSDVDTSQRAPGLDDPEEKVVSLSPSAAQPSTQSPSTTSEAQAPSSSTARTTPLAVKRRGQFMDIVAPTRSAPPRVSRQGVTLQPTETAAETPEETVPPVEAEESTVSTTETVPTLPSHDMESTGSAVPEPVASHDSSVELLTTSETSADSVEQPATPDLDEQTSYEQTSSESVPPVVDTPTDDTQPEEDDVPQSVVDEITAVTSDQSSEPLSSPFLSDAKVEKRPLGTPITLPDPIDTTPLTTETETLDDAKELSAEPAVDDAATSDAPADTSSDENQPVQLASEASAVPVPEELKTEVTEVESQAIGSPTESTVEPTQPVQPPAGGSIAQQYKEQPSSGDQTSGAIFDTATYHKGVETPEKKKASRKIVPILIWILALLALGAAAGAAYFYWSTR